MQVLALGPVAGSGGLHGRPGPVPQEPVRGGAGATQVQVSDGPVQTEAQSAQSHLGRWGPAADKAQEKTEIE